jgi:magnesium-transporting ATPase (P-type)
MEEQIASSNSHLVLRDVPFDGKTKISFKHRKISSTETCLYVKVGYPMLDCLLPKGAPEHLLEKSSHYINNGQIVSVDDKTRIKIASDINKQARAGSRIIGNVLLQNISKENRICKETSKILRYRRL